MDSHGSAEQMKPKLISAPVPWTVSAHAACLELHFSSDGVCPVFASFIAYFEANDHVKPSFGVSRTYRDPGPFRPATSEELGAAYHVVGVNFVGGLRGRLVESFSESQIIDEQAYDWSGVPSDSYYERTLEEGFALEELYLRETGFSADARMYEVENSEWISSLYLPKSYNHYMILGVDDYVEVIAKEWSWSLGQAVQFREN